MIKKLFIGFIFATLIFGCSESEKPKDPYAAFWTWFSSHSEEYLNYPPEKQNEMINTLHEEILKIAPDLAVELSNKKDDGTKELVISADGLKENIPYVQKLAETAPEISSWKIVAFRQRQKESSIVYKMEGVELDPKNVFFLHEPDGEKLGLSLFIDGYDENADTKDTYGYLTFLILDSALGEYDVMTKVGFIEMKPLSEKEVSALPIIQLSEVFDKYFEKK